MTLDAGLRAGAEDSVLPQRAVRATPLVRRIAQELGVDLATVAGTGPGGRVTEEDVRRAAGDRRRRRRVGASRCAECGG